jgi:Uma2 family endonuclease
MATYAGGVSTLAFGAYTLGDIEALENEHPEFGRIEVVHGALYAGGLEVGSDTHMSIVQALNQLLVPACPAGHVVRFDTWWHLGHGQLLSPDLAVWAEADRPGEEEAFRRPPRAVVEVLSLDSDHDLVTKHAIYRAHGVATWYVDRRRRFGWWLSDGDAVQVREPAFELTIPGWSPITITDAILTA